MRALGRRLCACIQMLPSRLAAPLVERSPVTSQRQLFPTVFERNSAHVHVRKRLWLRAGEGGGRCQHGRIGPEGNCFHVAAGDAGLTSFSLLISSAAGRQEDTAALIPSPAVSLLF